MDLKTEREKMLAGELYLASDPELAQMHADARRLLYEHNASHPDHIAQRKDIVRRLFGGIGTDFVVRPPFYCDYGCNIFAGDRLYINYDCTILDCGIVQIGNDVLIGPKVQLYAAFHPTDPQIRLSGKELAASISIGNNVWIGGGAIVCPGVSIGDNVTIGAGSVVTKDVCVGAIAVGNPCRVIKRRP
ncbi:MAG: sugar O-acetyltransferase [Cyanobacteria bacterium P01_D01_bin.36]